MSFRWARSWTARAFVLIANRLTRPGSEHALAEWLEQAYVSNVTGSRWQPQWKAWRRVKVSFDQLRLWYQTLDDLVAEKARIEVVLVGDRGMVKLANLEELRQAKQGYLVGLQRRNRQDVYDYLRAAEARSDWQERPPGIAASERATPPRTRVVKVPGKVPGVRVFVVHSEEREHYERGLRELAMERTRQSLEAIRVRVEQGELKEAEKIGAAVARALRAHHGQRYFAWELGGGQLHDFEHPVNLKREQALEGKHVIQTEALHLSALEAVAAYKELNEARTCVFQLCGFLALGRGKAADLKMRRPALRA